MFETLILTFVRPAVRRYLYHSSEPANTNVEGMIGLAGTVTVPVGSTENPGRVRIGGEEWRAISLDGSLIEEGVIVEVGSVDSATVIVQPKGAGSPAPAPE